MLAAGGERLARAIASSCGVRGKGRKTRRVRLWLDGRTPRYGLIMKGFLVGKGDFGGFRIFDGFCEIFVKHLEAY